MNNVIKKSVFNLIVLEALFCSLACERKHNRVPPEVVNQINRLDLAESIASNATAEFKKLSRTSQSLEIGPHGPHSNDSNTKLVATNIESDTDLEILIGTIERVMPVGSEVELLSFVESGTGFGVTESVRIIRK